MDVKAIVALVVLLVLFMTTGVAGEEPLEEITVSTAEELLAALGSNRRILLQKGVYNLDVAKQVFVGNANVYFEESYGGLELILDDVHNLTIQGEGDLQSEIVIEERDSAVMSFLSCSNIRIQNMIAGHTKEGGECSSGVFFFYDCAGVSIDGTQMYGCGTHGLELYKATDVEVSDSSVFGCTAGAVYITESENILFKNCVFRDNTGYAIIGAEDSSYMTVDSCAFLRNTGEYGMFIISGSENIMVTNTEFTDNDMKALVDSEGSDIEFDTTNRFENNTFDMFQ